MFLYGRSSNCDNEFIFPVHSWITSHLPFDVDLDHLRRIYTEEKAKVVTAVWGTEFIQVLATLAILHPNEFKNSMNSSFSSCPPGAIHPFLHIILSPKEQRRPLPSLLYKSFFYGLYIGEESESTFFGASERHLIGLRCHLSVQYNKTGFVPGSDSPKKSPLVAVRLSSCWRRTRWHCHVLSSPVLWIRISCWYGFRIWKKFVTDQDPARTLIRIRIQAKMISIWIRIQAK